MEAPLQKQYDKDVLKKHRDHYQLNKDEINRKNREYYKLNRERIILRRKEKSQHT